MTRSQKTIWETFLRWLSTRRVNTKWDFEADWRWKISVNKEIVSIENRGETKTYKRIGVNSMIYVFNDQCEIGEETLGCIGRLNENNMVIINSIQEKKDNEEEELERDNECSETIIEQIRQKVAVAATDAAIEGNYMATHWLVSTENNNKEWIGGI